MLFENKYKSVSPIKLRTGSSVPVIAQRRTNNTTYLTSRDKTQMFITATIQTSAQMFKNACTRTADGVCEHFHIDQPRQIAKRFQCACRLKTQPNPTQPGPALTIHHRLAGHDCVDIEKRRSKREC